MPRLPSAAAPTVPTALAIAAALGLTAACGARPIRMAVPPRAAPPVTPAPALGPPPPAPACLDAAVAVLDGPASAPLVGDGERLYLVGADPTTIEVAWQWGGPRVVLARGPAGADVVDVALGGGYVYWSISAHRHPVTGCVVAEDGAIYRVPVAGGAVETVVAAAGAPADLAIAGGQLWWRDEGPCTKDATVPTPRSIERLDLATGARTTVRDDPALRQVVVDGDAIYMVLGDRVARADLRGGGVTVLATGEGLGELTVQDGRIFVESYPTGPDAYVAEVPARGGALVRVMPVDSVATLWTDADTLYVSGSGRIVARPLAGGPLEVVAEDVQLAAIAGDRLLAWGSQDTLQSIPRRQRLHELVATGLIEPTSFATDATTLFWADRYGGLWSRPLGGGAAVRLAQDTGAEHHLAIVGDRLVFTSDGMDHHGPGALGVVAKAGGAVSWLGQDLSYPLSLAAAGDDVLVGDSRGAITRYRLDGSAPVRLTPEGYAGAVAALVADATQIYFARFEDTVVYRIARTGGAPAVVGEPTDLPLDLLLDGGDVVVATRFDGIQRIATTGGAPRMVARTAGVPGQLARDATHLYWASRDEIERVPRGGGAKEHVASGATALAVTDTAVYWSTYGVVHRLAKPAPGAAVGAIAQAHDAELGPIAVVGGTVYVGTRSDVRALDLTTGEFPVVAAPHRTPSWVGADATTVYFLAEDKFWAIDLAAAAQQRAKVLAKGLANGTRSTERERAFDTDFIAPLAQTTVTGVFDVELTGGAIVWTTGGTVMRMRTRTGLVDTLARGLVDAGWLAHDANQVYVTATHGAGWAVYGLGDAGAAPTKIAAIDSQPRGLAADGRGGLVVATETAVIRVSRTGATEVIAAHQRGAGPVAAAGATVYWMTRDGIMATDGTGCGAHPIARWPGHAGPPSGAALAAGAAGAVFSDPAAGLLVTAR